jgi:hypothetical protein
MMTPARTTGIPTPSLAAQWIRHRDVSADVLIIVYFASEVPALRTGIGTLHTST